MRGKKQTIVDVFSAFNPKTEAELVAAIAVGDEDAQAMFFERYRGPLMIILQRLVKSHTIAEDICQETFRIAFQKIMCRELREPKKLPAFIWSVAHQLAIEHFRKLPPPTDDLETLASLPDPSPDPLAQLLEKESDKVVRRLLAELRHARDREALYRFYVAEEDKQRICADLKLTAYQFNLILHRARARYRELYEEMQGER